PKATNYVSIAKLMGAVQGHWVIDPRIIIPAALLPPLSPGETQNGRKNLSLRTQTGAIKADVTLVPSISDPDYKNKPETQRVAAFEAHTMNGSVSFNLVRTARLPVKVALYTPNGAIKLSIPRSFRGVINGVCGCGSTKVSDEVNSQVSFSQDNGNLHQLFVGGMDSGPTSPTSVGDEVTAETRVGHIQISYDDEHEVDVGRSGSSGGILSTIWNAIF
ncbi:hypothetical protein DFP72DRAFT_810418, partial [Ephemerocybe angulata]